MRLDRMGCAYPTRLSFLRILLRRLGQDGATLTRPVWDMDAEGYGHAVYAIALGGHDYSLVCLTQALNPEDRSDRVIAEAWDAAFVLFDGVPGPGDIARIRANAPLQEAGRFSEKDLILSRANKSVRLFSEVVAALKAGRQPDRAMVRQTGYLMRTTAVYGNGKFGIADRDHIAARPGLDGPFMAEMLAVWMIRNFTHDLVEFLGGGKIDRDIKRHLGIGNATGLGMAPFLVSHPLLLHAWMDGRETALARARAVEALGEGEKAMLRDRADRATAYLAEWNVADAAAMARIRQARTEWIAVHRAIHGRELDLPFAVDRLILGFRRASLETQELLVALVLEAFQGLTDDLAGRLATAREPLLDGSMPAARLRALVAASADFALGVDYAARRDCAQFWYVSEEKLEPRIGLRHEEPGAERESPLDIARRVAALHAALDGQAGSVAEFLLGAPEHRAAARRVQTLAAHPYSEIRDNLIGRACRPIDMLRSKLAFFGASKFDPKSELWTRIALAQGAPLPDELGAPDNWWLASLP